MQFYKTIVGHGIRKVVQKYSLDKEEIIMLEVAEKNKVETKKKRDDFTVRKRGGTFSFGPVRRT